MRASGLWSVGLVGLVACSSSTKTSPATPTDSAEPVDSGLLADACVPSLPVRRTTDPVRADLGRELLSTGGLSSPLIPRVALDNLYWIWGGGRPAQGNRIFTSRPVLAKTLAHRAVFWSNKRSDAL
jgi:hypothetical protein